MPDILRTLYALSGDHIYGKCYVVNMYNAYIITFSLFLSLAQTRTDLADGPIFLYFLIPMASQQLPQLLLLLMTTVARLSYFRS